MVKTRVLMFGWEYPPYNSGGLGVACLGITRALAQRGYDVVFVMPKKLDVQSPWARFVFAESGAAKEIVFDSPLTPYVTSASYGHAGTGSMYARDLFSEVERYTAAGADIARAESCDIIYAHDWLSFGPAIEAKKVTGKPLIVHVHATEYDRGGGHASVSGHVYAIEKAGMEAADMVVAVSEFTKRLIVDHYGIPPEKIRVVHNGIDESTAPPSSDVQRMRSLKRSGKKIVLFLGRLTLQKGPDYFLRAAQKVVARNPNVLFVISGSGDMETRMMQLAGELGIASNVLFTGFLTGPDTYEMYAAADLFVMPSVSEPFGIAPLESMKIGTPVIISKQSGVSEVVRHALKVDFWDVDELAHKILSVVEMDSLHAELAKNARAEAERITWAQTAEKLDSLVHELVG